MQQPKIPVGFDRRRNLGLRHVAAKVADRSLLGELHVELSTRPDVEIEFELEPLGGGSSQHIILATRAGIHLELIAPVRS